MKENMLPNSNRVKEKKIDLSKSQPKLKKTKNIIPKKKQKKEKIPEQKVQKKSISPLKDVSINYPKIISYPKGYDQIGDRKSPLAIY